VSSSKQWVSAESLSKDTLRHQNKPNVIIVGAGWAGLAAAVDLTRHNFQVTLVEQSWQLGGRARGTQLRPKNPLPLDETLLVDNGQHLLMGAYTESLTLIDWLSTTLAPKASQPNPLFVRFPVHMRHVNGFEMRAPRLPAPFHLAWAWLTAKNLTLAQRIAMGYFFAWLKLNAWLVTGSSDYSVEKLLTKTHQPTSLIELLWRPLCLSALNTPPESASAKVFAVVLRDTLGSSAQASDFVVSRGSLGATLPDLSHQYLLGKNQTICLGASVKKINVVNRLSGAAQWEVTTRNEQRFSADYLLLATPYRTTRELLASAPLNSLLQEAPSFVDPLVELPIVTIYLYWRLTDTHTTKRPIMLAESAQKSHFGQWFFDLGPTPGGGRLGSVVISGPGSHLNVERQELADLVNLQVAQQLGWIPADQAWVITEKRATFACTVGLFRPSTDSGHDGIFLCGDQYRSEYPATLETAVRSGLKAAAQIREKLKISQGA
jgi:hydroxysqualene dehydroxylase